VRDLEDLSKERNALIEQRNDLSSELQDVRRRITEIEEQREHLKQKFAVEMDNQGRRLAEATQGTETLEMNPEDLSNARDRNALVRDLEDLSKERNALIEQRNDLSSELQDVRRRITEIEEQREHLKQKFAVEMDSQARLLRSRELMDELRQLTQDYNQRCGKLAYKESRGKTSLKHERDCLEEWYNQRKEKLAFLESTINNQAPGPSRPHPVCPEPLMAE